MENRIVLDRTTIIARILSIYLSVTGLGFLVSNSYYSEMISQSGSDPVLINLSGMVHGDPPINNCENQEDDEIAKTSGHETVPLSF